MRPPSLQQYWIAQDACNVLKVATQATPIAGCRIDRNHVRATAGREPMGLRGDAVLVRGECLYFHPADVTQGLARLKMQCGTTFTLSCDTRRWLSASAVTGKGVRGLRFLVRSQFRDRAVRFLEGVLVGVVR